MKSINGFNNKAKQLKREEHDLVKWFNMDKSNFITFDNDDLEELNKLLIKEFNKDYSLQLPKFDKYTIMDIAAPIIESQIYEKLKIIMPLFIFNNATKFNINVDDIKNKIIATKRAGRGLKVIKGEEKYPIYWDFSFNGIDERFEVKTKCANCYKRGGFNYTKNQKEHDGFIVISCTYIAEDGKYTINVNSLKIKRYELTQR